MDASVSFFVRALQSLPEAAASPLAFVAYIATVAAFVWIGMRTRQLKSLNQNLKEVPESQRPALVRELLGEVVPASITVPEWIQTRRQHYYFLAFVAVLFLLLCLAGLSAWSARKQLEDFRKEKELRDKVVAIMDEYNEATMNLHRLLVMRASDCKSNMLKYSESTKDDYERQALSDFQFKYVGIEYAVMDAILRRDYFSALENARRMKAFLDSSVALAIEKHCGVNPVKHLFGRIKEPLLGRLQQFPNSDLRAFVEMFEF